MKILDIIGGIFLCIFLTITAISILYGAQIKEYFRKKKEILVAIYRIPFKYYDYGWEKAVMDVYCYENEIGKRRIDCKQYTGKSHYEPYRTDQYSNLKDWAAGTSNLYSFPSYAVVAEGGAIFKNFT
jgi:hypothetical protein